MLSQRQQAQSHIYGDGISLEIKSKFGKVEKLIIKPSEADIKLLSNIITDLDKKFLEITKIFFNQEARQVKMETDMQIKGYTDVEDTYDYYPIRADWSVIAKSLSDIRSVFKDMASIPNYSFNKELKQNASNRISVGNITDTIEMHARQMANYAGLALPMKNFDRVYNKQMFNVDANGKKIPGTTYSIRDYIESNVWADAGKYLTKYFADISGTKKAPDGLTKELGKLRENVAKAQLGWNIKVWFNQLTSYPTASVYIKPKNLFKALFMKSNSAEMDNYCDYAKYRNYNNEIVKTESLSDKVGKIGDITTKPIQMFDRMVMKRLWNACKLEVSQKNNIDISSEECNVEAGKLLETVIRNTQPNYNASERAEISRSDNELVKSFTMFMSQPLQNLSLVSEGWYEINSLHKMMKAEGVLDELKTRLNEAKIKLAKGVSSVLVETILFVAVSQIFKRIRGKDDKDKPMEDILDDFVGSMTGMLPFIRDIYGYVTKNYDINVYAVDSFTNLIDSTKSMYNSLDKVISGQELKYYEIYGPIRSLTFSAGQILGIPTRNMYNTLMNLIRKVDYNTFYKLNNKFSKTNYISDLQKAVENNDEDMISTITGIMLNERVGGIKDAKTQKEINSLVSKGYSVLPRSIGNKITYNGEELELTNKQLTSFRNTYSKSMEKLSSLTNNPSFSKLSAEQKSKAINFVYDYYYQEALKNLLGTDSADKKYLFGQAINIETLAQVVAYASSIEADSDKKGNIVSGSKKTKITKYINSLRLTAVQKYMLMGYLGYKNANGEKQVKENINSLKLTAKEKENLISYSGY